MSQRFSAHDIAQRDLIECQTDVGFIAGPHHFVDLWARDSLFATFGANVTGFASVSKKTIETFLRHQRRDGLIPYLVQRSPLTLNKYLFGRQRYFSTPVPAFRSHQSGGTVPDGGLMAVIATSAYLKQHTDRAFLRKYYAHLLRAMDWYESRFPSGLISEWFLCEWADAVLKVGKTLYTNVLYAASLSDMVTLAHLMGDPKRRDGYRQKARHTKALLQKEFWNGSYFADWIDWRRQDYFATHANMLAIIFGLSEKHQSQKIVDYAANNWQTFTLTNSSPVYPFWRIPIHHYVVGMGDYHNGMRWLQPGITYALALYTVGRIKKAKDVLRLIGDKIEEYQAVYEVYEKSGKPVKRWFYASEHPFAWSAGLYLWASHILAKS